MLPLQVFAQTWQVVGPVNLAHAITLKNLVRPTIWELLERLALYGKLFSVRSSVSSLLYQLLYFLRVHTCLIFDQVFLNCLPVDLLKLCCLQWALGSYISDAAYRAVQFVNERILKDCKLAEIAACQEKAILINNIAWLNWHLLWLSSNVSIPSICTQCKLVVRTAC